MRLYYPTYTCSANANYTSIPGLGANNQGGQCVLPPTTDAAQVTKVKLDGKFNTSDITLFAAGGAHSVVVTLTKTGSSSVYSIFTFGSNQYGQLGAGDTTVKAGVQTVPNGLFVNKIITHIGASWHTVARLADGSLIGWGLNTHGQLSIPGQPTGTTTTPNPQATINTPTQMEMTTPGYCTYMAVGYATTFAVSPNGVYAIGNNLGCVMGVSTFTTCASSSAYNVGAWTKVSLNVVVIQIESSSQQTAFLDNQGGVYVAGKNDYGTLLGLSQSTIYIAPTKLNLGTAFISKPFNNLLIYSSHCWKWNRHFGHVC